MNNETIERIRKIFNEIVHTTSSPNASTRDVVKYAQENNIDCLKKIKLEGEEV